MSSSEYTKYSSEPSAAEHEIMWDRMIRSMSVTSEFPTNLVDGQLARMADKTLQVWDAESKQWRVIDPDWTVSYPLMDEGK